MATPNRELLDKNPWQVDSLTLTFGSQELLTEEEVANLYAPIVKMFLAQMQQDGEEQVVFEEAPGHSP